MTESLTQQRVRLEAARDMLQLWRNNTGVLKNENGVPVRYGLCNDSKELNQKIKSSDLIGITPTLITQEMVGYFLGVFTAIECKPEDWKFLQSDKRAVAQLAYHDIVRQAGGFAGFATNIQDYKRIVRK